MNYYYYPSFIQYIDGNCSALKSIIFSLTLGLRRKQPWTHPRIFMNHFEGQGNDT